jgi:prolipoprotein diacylglyceryltransferase
MDHLLTITWDLGRGLDLGFFTLRYYSLLFAAGFILGYFIMKRIFEREGVPQEKLDTLLTYVVVATILGARLGHVFFYQWDYYSQHPSEIFKVWEGGLASHGAAIAIVIAIIIYSKRELTRSPLWMLDRVVLTVALAGCLIRLGNFANSEIYGNMGNSELQTVFTNPVRERITSIYGEYINAVDFDKTDAERVTDSIIFPVYNLNLSFTDRLPNQEVSEQLVMQRVKPMLAALQKEDKNLLITGDRLEWDPDVKGLARVEAIGIPRAPTQLYEAAAYLIIFFILMRLFMVPAIRVREGLFFGAFLLLVFGFRFVIEFFKENQVTAEQGMQYNIGQLLSIPLVLIGLFFIIKAKPKKYE